jgi:Asp-tRNA(Asn)/Glu-tRNA(Gln) amidotransferase A subunit family amidase
MEAISGHDPRDPGTADAPVPDMLAGIERGARGLRIGVPPPAVWDHADPEVAGLVRKAVAEMEGAGAAVVEIAFARWDAYAAAVGPVLLAEAAAYHAPTFPSRKQDYSSQVAGMLELGRNINVVTYIESMRVLQAARAGEADDALAGIDVLAVPTVPDVAPTIAAIKAQDEVVHRTTFTSLFDLTGQPVISVPCGLVRGMPAAVSFVARRWDEVNALRAGRAYEQVRGPFPAPETRPAG